MGLFGKFKRQTAKNTPLPVKTHGNQKSIPSTNRQENSSGSNTTYPGKVYSETTFERDVITFDKRKETCIPSSRGLYVAEILLLHYCSLGTYPHPKNGYPGFWWFEYGIQDVDYILKTLVDRGFIYYNSPKYSLNGLIVNELKQILKEHNLPVSGKKDELIERIKSSFSDSDLIALGIESKYALTEMGQKELEENAYVPYMHKHHSKTIEDATFGMEFNVWSINKKLGYGDKANWKEVADCLL